MAKKPLPPKRPMGGPPGAPGGAPSAVQSEAVGKFDKFAAFALAIPSGILAIVTLVIAIGYTNSEFDVGFFGFPTLGYHLAASFENLYYGEVWTYLYVLLVLVLVVDWWSGRLRRELVS